MGAEKRPPAETKVSLAPDLRALSQRAQRAWVEKMAVWPVGDQYAVNGESDTTYIVDPREGSCSCPDHRIRGATCKHLRRVAIEITARRVPPPRAEQIECRACDRETVVSREVVPPRLCSECRLSEGEVVLDRETGERLVVVTVTDERADSVEIRAAETTVADYPTNEGYPADNPVVRAAYLDDIVHSDDPTEYAFPLSRLSRADDAALVE